MFISAATTLAPRFPAPLRSTIITTGNSVQTDGRTASSPTATTPDTNNLSDEQRRQIGQLQSRDREVRAHEAAHIAAGGELIRGSARFSYQQGPDGQRYAIGGEVSIDTSPVKDDPEATLQKAQKVQAAALAPAQPSTADRAVAASASQMATTARATISAQNTEPGSMGNTKSGVETSEGRNNPAAAAHSYQTINTATGDRRGNLLNAVA